MYEMLRTILAKKTDVVIDPSKDKCALCRPLEYFAAKAMKDTAMGKNDQVKGIIIHTLFVASAALWNVAFAFHRFNLCLAPLHF
jgi:hypothetical protein